MAPRGLRPKLDKSQLVDLSHAHNQSLDCIARGQADEATLWQYLGGCLTWGEVARRLQLGEPEMAEQTAVATRLLTRYQRTGRVAFDGPDYQRAKEGVVVMDLLAEACDRPTAIAAADWSERKVNELAEAMRATVEAAHHAQEAA